MSARIRENSGLQNELSSAPHAGFNNSQTGVLYIYNSVHTTLDNMVQNVVKAQSQTIALIQY